MENQPDTTPSFWSKNIWKIVALTLLAALMFTLIVMGVNRLLPSSNDIQASVTPKTLMVNDSLFYQDSSHFAKSYRWIFGDGTQSYKAKGYHQYSKSGNYTVTLTINDKYTGTFLVTVKDTIQPIAIEDSIMHIECPDAGMQFENMVFRAMGRGANQYRWRFGESDYVDSRESFVQYYYKKPGTYTILLYTDNNEYPTRKTITIYPSYQAAQDSLINDDDLYKAAENDFKAHLQQIANGQSFNTHYYYLLQKYLCNNEKAAIKINGQKLNDFNNYCLGLQFDKGVTIQSVKLIPSEKKSAEEKTCMKIVEVMQDRKL